MTPEQIRKAIEPLRHRLQRAIYHPAGAQGRAELQLVGTPEPPAFYRWEIAEAAPDILVEENRGVTLVLRQMDHTDWEAIKRWHPVMLDYLERPGGIDLL